MTKKKRLLQGTYSPPIKTVTDSFRTQIKCKHLNCNHFRIHGQIVDVLKKEVTILTQIVPSYYLPSFRFISALKQSESSFFHLEDKYNYRQGYLLKLLSDSLNSKRQNWQVLF